MTPAQLRAYSAVVLHGSVHGAAQQLGMTDAGVSTHVAQLRRELDDQLFTRTASGLAFTPGGLRLASRAIEILGLQRQTAIEVGEASRGRRLLRIAASGTFAEHAAPGLIDLFAGRAKDLSVELSVHPTSAFSTLIKSRAVDIALGPRTNTTDPELSILPFLKYQIIAVTRPDSPLTGAAPTPSQLRDADWMLGPAAGSADGTIATMLRTLHVPESRQRIFQSDAAALEEVRHHGGITLIIGFAVATDLATKQLIRLTSPGLQSGNEWCALTLATDQRPQPVSELLRFITTPRCTQAMIRGSGVGITRFRPKIHVTLWS